MQFDITQALKNNNSLFIAAKEVDITDLAEQLRSIGFTCKRCGKCCRSHHGDNTVIVFPDEVLRIMDANNLNWQDVCKPSAPQFVDNNNTLHSFEWELKRCNSGLCTFLNKDNTCSVYFWRPWICRTYPFYLHFENHQTPRITISECDGVGKGSLNKKEAGSLALHLKERLISEIQEEIQLLEHLDGLENWHIFNGNRNGNHDEFNRAIHDGCGCTMVERHSK